MLNDTALASERGVARCLDGSSDPGRRFMGSLHDFRITHRDHEPATDRSADSLVREFLGIDSCGHGCPRSDRRFMESLHDFSVAHWDHEPLRLTEARSGPRVCDPQPARFMESSLFLSDLLTAHEPDRVCGVPRCREQCGRCRPLVPCARWKDWFRWWASAHFGETRVGFPAGKICLLPELHRAFGVGPTRTT